MDLFNTGCTVDLFNIKQRFLYNNAISVIFPLMSHSKLQMPILAIAKSLNEIATRRDVAEFLLQCRHNHTRVVTGAIASATSSISAAAAGANAHNTTPDHPPAIGKWKCTARQCSHGCDRESKRPPAETSCALSSCKHAHQAAVTLSAMCSGIFRLNGAFLVMWARFICDAK